MLQPIATALGIPKGRDSIYLGTIEHSVCPREITFRGNIESLVPGASVRFVLRFHGLLELHSLELDFTDFGLPASFVEVVASERVAAMKRRDHSAKVRGHRHFILATYDEVFEVICQGYELALEEPLPHLPPEEGEQEGEDG